MRRGDRLYLEIGPLGEGQYTGIAQVTAALAEQMLGETTREVAFFHGRSTIERSVVEDLVLRRNGDLLLWYVRRGATPPAPEDLDGPGTAIFANRKTCRRAFRSECQIIHDLSTLLTPQFHNQDTIDFHALSLLDDVRTNDLTFCVSEATRDDVLRYLGPLDPARVVVLPLACAIPAEDVGRFLGREIEPYVLVLGTIEPRKNAEQILARLRENQELLRARRFVFLGRFGWGESIDSLVQRLGLIEEYRLGRIMFPGFVCEAAKHALLENAQLLIYPSLFEGFGLPVLEALALGVPCVTTRSSSIPEVGGDHCYYFDPNTPREFDRALNRALIDVPADDGTAAHERRSWAARFSWGATYRRMTAAIDALTEEE